MLGPVFGGGLRLIDKCHIAAGPRKAQSSGLSPPPTALTTSA